NRDRLAGLPEWELVGEVRRARVAGLPAAEHEYAPREVRQVEHGPQPGDVGGKRTWVGPAAPGLADRVLVAADWARAEGEHRAERARLAEERVRQPQLPEVTPRPVCRPRPDFSPQTPYHPAQRVEQFLWPRPLEPVRRSISQQPDEVADPAV